MSKEDNRIRPPTEPKITSSTSARKRRAGKLPARWIAVFIGLLVIIGVLGGMIALSYKPAGSSGGSATLASQVGSVSQGKKFSATINATGSFTNMTVYFGDGASKLIKYSGSNSVKVSHTYKLPGNYYIFADINYGSSTGYFLQPLKVTPKFPPNYAFQSMSVDPSQSSPLLENNISNILQDPAHMTLNYNPPIGGGNNQIVSQSFVFSNQSGVISNQTVPWSYNFSQKAYINPLFYQTYANLNQGMYVLEINTTTALVNTTHNGIFNSTSTATSHYFEDFPVVKSLSKQSSSKTSLTHAEPDAPGGYTTLDPQIAYYTVDNEVLQNTILPLDTYNGSSTGSFIPAASTKLPSVGNGLVNSNYSNYTEKAPGGARYTVHQAPGQNYTFPVNSSIAYADGSTLSAWDFEYAFARLLLFDAGSPGTPGWINAQYLLPGDYFTSNTFYNITNNITVNNASNTITFHFQKPMPSVLVYQVFASVWAEPASWFKAHGAGIKWSSSGFQNYKSEGNLAGYNSYVQNHVMADGPYQLSYVVPGSQVTLEKNPSYVPPNKYFVQPKINTLNFLYVGSNQQSYLMLKSGQAQWADLPTTYWNATKSLVSSGRVQVQSYPTLNLYFYTFTLNINEKILHGITSQANVPSELFMNPNVRKAFAYAYNYSLYFSQQLGNKVYHTKFYTPYAGMLPPGMLYNQTSADLMKSGANVVNANGHEPAQLAKAKKYWDIFMKTKNSAKAHDGPAAMGLSMSGGKLMYKGKPLAIPVVIPSNDPADQSGATTWGRELANVIPGAKVIPVSLPLTDIFSAYAIQGQNPMAVSWGGWAPDYPYPTDYLLPMGMPLNGSTYMGPAGFTPSIAGNTSQPVWNLTEAATMQKMLNALGKATNNSTNPAMAKHWFHVVNGMIVNSTEQVYIGQQDYHYYLSSRINGNAVKKYEMNVEVDQGGMMYQFLPYNTSKA